VIGELAAGNVITVRHELRQDEDDLAVYSEPMKTSEPALAAATLVETTVEPDEAEIDTATASSLVESAPIAESMQAASAALAVSENHYTPHRDADMVFGSEAIARRLSRNGQQIVLVSSAEDDRNDYTLAAEIQDMLTSGGASTVLINAGGPDQTRQLGLTDMVEGDVDFGSIISVGPSEDQHSVAWGSKRRLNFNGERFSLMLDALCEVYDHVIVSCGQFGIRAPLPPFANKDAALLITGANADPDQLAFMQDDAHAIGIENVSLVALQNQQSNVA